MVAAKAGDERQVVVVVALRVADVLPAAQTAMAARHRVGRRLVAHGALRGRRARGARRRRVGQPDGVALLVAGDDVEVLRRDALDRFDARGVLAQLQHGGRLHAAG